MYEVKVDFLDKDNEYNHLVVFGMHSMMTKLTGVNCDMPLSAKCKSYKTYTLPTFSPEGCEYTESEIATKLMNYVDSTFTNLVKSISLCLSKDLYHTYKIEVEYSDSYQIDNNNYISNFIIHTLEDKHVVISKIYGTTIDDKTFCVEYESCRDEVSKEMFNVLKELYKRNISKIRVYKDNSLKIVYERNMDNSFRKAIEDEYSCNVKYDSSISVYVADKSASYPIVKKLKALGCEVVGLSDKSFVCNYHKDKCNPLEAFENVSYEHIICMRQKV